MNEGCGRFRWKLASKSPLIASNGMTASRSPPGTLMAVFNNLVMFDQHIPQNRLDTIVPDLAVEWSWSEDGTTLAFKLRQDVSPPDSSERAQFGHSAPTSGV
jgi:ABC-type transport system substrate-binding protein